MKQSYDDFKKEYRENLRIEIDREQKQFLHDRAVRYEQRLSGEQEDNLRED
jgi:hypothetical protein